MASQQIIAPHPGAQTAFLASQADIAVFGGAAGAGKGTVLVLDPLRHCQTPGFRGVIFSRHPSSLDAPGSVWDVARHIYGLAGARMRGKPERRATWAPGGSIEVTCLGDVGRFHGHEYAYMGFDDLAEVEAEQFWRMLARLRSTCGVRPYVRAATNPDADSWVRGLIDWWIGDDGMPIPERSGVLRYFVRIDGGMRWGDTADEAVGGTGLDPTSALSLTFVSATLADNPSLRADQGYTACLGLLSARDRKRLVDGSWAS